MDLGTIKERLEANYYYSGQECLRDFNLVFYNCYMYYKPGSEIIRQATALEMDFIKMVSDGHLKSICLKNCDILNTYLPKIFYDLRRPR